MAPTTPPTDEELDTLISARLRLIGVDLGQLPVSDPAAPADQTRILASLRGFLRTTVPVVSNYALDVQRYPPVIYPSPFSAWTEEDA